ncbi:Glutathione S-transferase S1 [Dissophora globulifera]|nr:Glutathione S-transferase S1 [Dissophora globulifera]
MVHPCFDPAKAAIFNEISRRKDSSFEISYFNVHGRGAVIRTILLAAGANFTNNIIFDSPEAPFGVIPVFKETSFDGKVIQLTETDAIERYLCRKFDMCGSDDFEENAINAFVSNSRAVFTQFLFMYYGVNDPVLKAAVIEQLTNKTFADWVKHHEQHLTDAGSNGHYVGNKTTLADFLGAYMISVVLGITGDALISPSKTPALWKVKTTLYEIPTVAAWTKTEEFKTFSELNYGKLGYH